jgi:hypothetical protein
MAAWSIQKRLWRLSTVLWLMAKSCSLLQNNNRGLAIIAGCVILYP